LPETTPYPPVAARAAAGVAAQIASQEVAREVHAAHRDALARLLNWEAQVAVVGDDDGRVHRAAEDVRQKMRGQVVADRSCSWAVAVGVPIVVAGV
jgi:hypothetical protein